MRVTSQYASAHFEEVLAAAERGEDVEIDRAHAAIRLSVVPSAKEGRKNSLLGAAKGQIWMSDDFKSPEQSEEMADLFENSSLS